MNARQPNCYRLIDLPQRGSVEKQAFGTGWWELDQLFKFYLGQFVVVTGLAGSGKSTFMLNVLVKVAKQQGIGSFLYVPENEAYLYEKLRRIWNDDETFEHFASTLCTVQSATQATIDEAPHTLNWVLERAADVVADDKFEIVMIDPWNELERAKPRDQLMTDYIGDCLMLIKRFCRSLNAIVIMIAHPTKAVNEKGRVTTLADIEGSMNWFNKCDNGLVVVREAGNNRGQVLSAKVRERGAGRLGVCHFQIDPQTEIFIPDHGAVQ